MSHGHRRSRLRRRLGKAARYGILLLVVVGIAVLVAECAMYWQW